jgi:hypothetical protein
MNGMEYARESGWKYALVSGQRYALASGRKYAPVSGQSSRLSCRALANASVEKPVKRMENDGTDQIRRSVRHAKLPVPDYPELEGRHPQHRTHRRKSLLGVFWLSRLTFSSKNELEISCVPS